MTVHLQRTGFLPWSLCLYEDGLPSRQQQQPIRDAGHARGNELQGKTSQFGYLPDKLVFNALFPHRKTSHTKT